MVSLKCWLIIHVWSIWIAFARGCDEQQTRINGWCCDLCPPGKYVKEFCTEHRKTICSPCENGSFSDHYSVFDTCKECQSCQQEYAEKCTPTSNARCSCDSGFLCSNNVCSACEENKCTAGEKLKRTETPIGAELLNYSYQCELVCPGPAYFDVKANNCKPWTQCNAFGLAELFPGNKTHNSVCDVQALTHGRDRETSHVILGISFVVFSLAFLVSFFLSFTCVKNLRKHKANHYPMLAVSTNNTDYHLSKEESGLQLIIQDESKDNNNIELHLGRDTPL
ncbi:tumor necrosis factor receptor superfamily member 18 [Solea solea]|uniref:tumor necrosis factor receptor superfamily member 18 n=1 Tax=Solea solea TaxID=90069 RepID=UPI00272C66EA|nr:tumor necrosis factor receptor superfamily member 18 [Solea solea]